MPNLGASPYYDHYRTVATRGFIMDWSLTGVWYSLQSSLGLGMASDRNSTARYSEGPNGGQENNSAQVDGSRFAECPYIDSPIFERLTKMLDQVEMRVELLRQNAVWMEQEKDALQTMIQTIQTNRDLGLIREGEREEIQINADRVLARLLTIDVTVATVRNENQEQALASVNRLIDETLVRLKDDEEGTRTTLQTYLNACSAETLGPINQKFQQVIIECTADDQKKVRHRLNSLLSTKDTKQ